MPTFLEEVCGNTSDDMENQLRTLKINSLDGEDREDFCDYDEEDDQQPVTLGFAESPKHSWSLLPQLFPSLAGGTPAWLEPIDLPRGTSCVCSFCDQPLQFLLQVYAPLSEKESTFHRTLYVFMCPSMACLLRDQHEQWRPDAEKACRSVKVFRCQLARFNSFYSSEPPRNDGTDKPLITGAELCSWCSTWRGDKICGGCRKARYCSKIHQAANWQNGHRTECRESFITAETSLPSSSSATAGVRKAPNYPLWPQFEIVTEDESDHMENSNTESASALVSQGQVNESIESLMSNFEGDEDKKTWVSFQDRISWAPEQVLRYYRCKNAKPLWPMSTGQPSKMNIPACRYCGGPRSCEFQVLPQLLYYFGVDNDVNSLDWATIVVYTCDASCEGSVIYKEEVAWVQLLTQSSSVNQ